MPNRVAQLKAGIEAAVLDEAHGPAAWRARRAAAKIVSLLRRQHLVPPSAVLPPIAGHVALADLARRPELLGQVNAHLLAHRIGYWEWSAIDASPDGWTVTVFQHHPQGGPLFGMVAGLVEALTYRRVVPAPGGDQDAE